MNQTIFSFSDEMEKIKIPKDMDDAKALGTVLSKYKDTYYTQVLVAYFATYILYPWRNHLEPEKLWAFLPVDDDVLGIIYLQSHSDCSDRLLVFAK